jgi:hypothetical protein
MEHMISLFESGNCCGFQRDPKESKLFDEEWNQIQHEFPQIHFNRWNTMQNMAKFNKEKEIARLMTLNGKGILPILLMDNKIIMIEHYPSYFELRDLLNSTV